MDRDVEGWCVESLENNLRHLLLVGSSSVMVDVIAATGRYVSKWVPMT